jgi:hypothetical protein
MNRLWSHLYRFARRHFSRRAMLDASLGRMGDLIELERMQRHANQNRS